MRVRPRATPRKADAPNDQPEVHAEDVVLELTAVSVSFPSAAGEVQAAREVSFSLRRGEVLGIVGESGSGKSMTCLAIMGLLPRNARVTGSVRCEGTELVGASEKQLTKVRGKQIAMIFQDPMTSLNPVYTVGWQLVEALRAHDKRIRRREARERAAELLELVGIPDARARLDNYPHEFSGGMRQRVVIALAMANRPDVVIADEPTTALDVTVQAQVLQALARARAETGAALILITHDLGVVAGTADRVIVMYAGRPVEIGTVEEIFYEPRMPYTLGLLGSLPRLDQQHSKRLVPIPSVPSASASTSDGCRFAPRCPMNQDVCWAQEPALRPTTGPDHLAACHFPDALKGMAAGDLFAPSPGPVGLGTGATRGQGTTT